MARGKTKSAADTDKYAYPLESGSGFDGGVADHMARAFGNWQSDNAVDIMCSVGTKVLAVDEGTISRVDIDSSYDPNGNPNGDSVYLDCSGGRQFWYTHMHGVAVKAGDKITKGGLIGNSGTANGVDHLHFAAKPPLNPEDVVTNSVSTGVQGDTTSGGGVTGFSEEDIFAIGRAAAVSTQFTLEGLLNFGITKWMTGAKSVYNDEPLLPFIQQLAQASMRHFQSLPDGSFFSFFPDYFGTYNHRDPYWLIDDIEILDGSIDLNDEALATHVFVVGDTNPDGQITVPEQLASKGVVTIFDAFASSFMIQKDDDRKSTKKDQKGLVDREAAFSFLRRYGIRPNYEDAPFIRNHMFEMFYAFTQFQLLWSRQFLTQFQFTFMPELYPGGVVAFPDHGVRCYIDAVTHTFDYETGFTTQANLSAPAAYADGKKNPHNISQGMIVPLTDKELKQLRKGDNGKGN